MPYLAWSLLPGGPEFIVIMIIGLLLFGRDLPRVGKAVGKTVVQLRQGFQKLKDEIALEEEMREVKDSVREVESSVRGVGDQIREETSDITDARRVLTDPGKLFEDLTDEGLSSPAPVADGADPKPGEPDAGEVREVQQTGTFQKLAEERANNHTAAEPTKPDEPESPSGPPAEKPAE